MTRYLATLAFAFSAVAFGASTDISKVNGSIVIEAGQQAGDVETVNGSVTIGKGARVDDIETVNGSVRMDDDVVVSSAESVNGEITLGARGEVHDDATTVNGAITLAQGAKIGGKLENVNGKLQLDGASVGGGISTVNGDVYIASGSRVEGGIHVEKNSGWHMGKKPKNPRITIESGAVVTGPLKFEREVDLYVGAGVQLPAIEGIQPQRFAL
jgi:DUF4097 and DUF4098 domain-containing protein YvlB